MHTQIKKIIHDLYELDPSLKERDAEIRDIVALLTEANPDITPDTTFVRELRTQLLVSQIHTRRAPHHSPFWWLTHLAPIGVISVLTLVLTPTLLKQPTVEPVMESDMLMRVAAPQDDTSAKQQGATPDVATFMQIAADAPLESSFLISPQTPGNSVTADYVSLVQPGFIVIQTVVDGGVGDIIGASTLLPQGVTEQVVVTLNTASGPEQTFFATLYTDDGDGVFTTTDTPLYDASGTTPLSTLFSTQ